MASGRNAPAAAAPRPSAGDAQRTVADTERLGVDVEVADRPAHAWEVGDAESWEPAVTDTWNPPSGASSRRGREVAASTPGPEGETLRPAERTESPAERAARSARQALDEAMRTPSHGEETREPELDPARMALGLASLAAERMRGGVPAGDGFVTGFGLARQTANGLLALGQRLLEPASRVAAEALQVAARVPVAGLPVRVALRSGQWLARSAAQIREAGATAITSGPEDEQAAPFDAELSTGPTEDSPQETSKVRSKGVAAKRR